ncbi:MAG: glycosyltransferase [Aestuariibaculum sp.]
MNRLLILGFVWPEPKSSAAGSRMLQLIYFFKAKNYNITFASTCAKTQNAFDLNNIGIDQVTIKLNDSGFNDFVKTLNPNVVLFDRFMVEEQFGWRVAEQCPKALRILDTEDLHGLRKGRQQAFKDKKPFNKNYLFNDYAKREVASIYRCDLSLIISEYEMELLKNDFKVDTALLLYLPFLQDEISKKNIKTLPNFGMRQHFVTIGNFLHEPNYNAVQYLKESIWPIIKKQLPMAEMHVYGAYAKQKANKLHNKEQRFLVKGFAPDVNYIMQHARICLAPIRFGAGLKGKLIDAMVNGTPCVTTNIGAEGMFGNMSSNACIANVAEDFANSAVQLYLNENIWNEKQANGFNIINTRFCKKKYEKKFIQTIEEIRKNLIKRRLDNFTGQMLRHHSMQSTRFMGKWIEEKQKNKNF